MTDVTEQVYLYVLLINSNLNSPMAPLLFVVTLASVSGSSVGQCRDRTQLQSRKKCVTSLLSHRGPQCIPDLV